MKSLRLEFQPVRQLISCDQMTKESFGDQLSVSRVKRIVDGADDYTMDCMTDLLSA